ncbi:hypothetical protein MKW98_026384 [Papaver atlanticum]|uniref:RanBD1 domain-containing protein n=1 Tax=Papaver atlanticum TaxID=357466 RepID=A0AAD4SQE8_9MAGN|nr:hypothetical protein MKW98_026384 [Papaver atlanticum]
MMKSIERGVETLKILKHEHTEKVGLVMRQSKPFKICVNHLDISLMEPHGVGGTPQLFGIKALKSPVLRSIPVPVRTRLRSTETYVLI